MKHKITKKALSLTSAAVICCSAMPGLSCFSASASAAPVKEDNGVMHYYYPKTDELVKVIVKVKGDAVMEQPAAETLGTDYLDTPQASQITSQLVSAQKRVQNSIRRLYPELQITYSYQMLVNGFSCELPAELIPQIQALPAVESVSRVSKHSTPKMAKAAALSGFPSYFDQTGCSGEGQVIAVIDSELDVTHPMFAPLADGIETALSKEDIAEIVSSGTLNVDVDPERAYISNKLPFVIDYAGDPYEGVPEPTAYHGTHVSGIAAGNEITDAEGKTISGIAKDAQLIFMGVSAGMGYIDDAAALAAIEDAVKLHADVINMSWGDELEYYGENPLSEAITNAENAGVVACIAAGNSDNGHDMYGRINYPDNPDVSTMNGSADLGVGALFVASADNNYTVHRHSFVFNGERIAYRPTLTNEEIYLDSCIEPGDYEYADCGDGSAEAFADVDVEGKIALIQRGTVYFEDMIFNAMEKGAIGVILADREIPDGMEYAVLNVDALPMAVVTYEEGQMLRDAENKIISIDSETVDQDLTTKVSSYTSYGVKESLDLRPDIMGIGGNVESAAYDQGEEVLSGTSMATPYLSGCVAVMRQHMEKLNLDLNGKDKAKYIRNLLMDSAIPYTEDDMYVTPRRQGAGLVSLDRMLANKVVVTGAEGEAKVNLYDNLSENFSFDVNLSNISDEDVTFSNAKLVLTTDDVEEQMDMDGNMTEMISGQQVLNCSADLSALLSVGAGQSRTETVSVSLDPAQCAALRETFVNGFFAEGYLVLEGAENCCDVSIPLLGFCGDWAQVPAFKEMPGQTGLRFGTSNFNGNLPLSEMVADVAALSKRIPHFRLNGDPAQYSNFLVQYNPELYFQIQEKLTDGTRPVYISPNTDGLGDSFALNFEYIRQCILRGMNVYDENGNCVSEGFEDPGPPRMGFQSVIGMVSHDLEDLPDGKYTGTVEMKIDYPTSKEHPQTLSTEFYIDNTAPAVDTEFLTKNGRKIMRLTASDAGTLDGIYIFGKGKGGIAESYDPNADAKGVDLAFGITALIGAFSDPYMFDGDSHNTDNLSLMGHLLCCDMNLNEISSDTFMDVIPAECGEDGSFTVEYDVTDLTDYSVEVLDRAYNITTLYYDRIAPEQLLNGVFMSADSFYEVTPDTIRVRSCRDGSESAYTYTLTDGTLTMTDENGTDTVYTAEVLSDSKMRFRPDNGNAIVLRSYTDAENLDAVSFVTLDEMMETLREMFRKSFDTDPTTETVEFITPEEVHVQMSSSDPESEDAEEAFDSYTVDLLTGLSMSYFSYGYGGANDTDAVIEPGLYYSDYFGYIQFNDDNATGSVFDPMAFTKEECEFPFTYSFDEDGVFTITRSGETYTGRLKTTIKGELIIHFDDPDMPDANLELLSNQPITIDDFHTMNEVMQLVVDFETAVCSEPPFMMMAHMEGGKHMIVDVEDFYSYDLDPITLTGTFNGKPVDLNNPPTLPDKAYSLEELCSMASVDYEKRTGTPAMNVKSRIMPDGDVVLEIMGDTFAVEEIYTVDAVTGKGEDTNGNALNLPKTGIMNPDTLIMAAAALLLMLGGTELCAAAARKKKEQQ